MMLVPTPYSIRQDDDRDVFAEIFTGDTPIAEAKRGMMWAMYSDVGIGNCDVDYWIRCMQNKEKELADVWNTKIQVTMQLMDKIEKEGPDYSDSTLETTSVNSHMDPPSGTSGTDAPEAYISSQDRTDYTQKSDSGLETVTVSQWLDGMPDTMRDWAKEFKDLFYWGM